MIFPPKDHPDYPAFMEGYAWTSGEQDTALGELERIALATANGELRSQLRELTARLEGPRS